MAKWKCDRCDTVHRRNPSRCRSCGSTVLSPYHGEGGLLDDQRLRYALVGLAVVSIAVVLVVVL